VILRGEIYHVDLGIPIGHEPSSLRPGVVVSADLISNGPGGLVGIVPVTSTRYGLRSHIELEEGVTGLDHLSFARCDQLRMISVLRVATRLGYVPIEQMSEIDQALRFIFDL
jgi:mRNA interferase MazF